MIYVVEQFWGRKWEPNSRAYDRPVLAQRRVRFLQEIGIPLKELRIVGMTRAKWNRKEQIRWGQPDHGEGVSIIEMHRFLQRQPGRRSLMAPKWNLPGIDVARREEEKEYQIRRARERDAIRWLERDGPAMTSLRSLRKALDEGYESSDPERRITPAVYKRTNDIITDAAAILGEGFPFGYLSDDGVGGARLEFDHVDSRREVVVRIFNEGEGDGPGDIFSKWGPATRELPPTGANLAAELEWLRTGERAKEEAPAVLAQLPKRDGNPGRIS